MVYLADIVQSNALVPVVVGDEVLECVCLRIVTVYSFFFAGYPEAVGGIGDDG